MKDDKKVDRSGAADYKIRCLLIVSHVVHYRHAGQWFAYGAYAREIDIWADLFPEVLIAAPCRDGMPAGDCLPLTRSNIALAPQRETNGHNWREKIVQLLVVIPQLVWTLARAMRRADAIHVRCPGHIGLLGAVLAPLFSRYLVAKYAGAWNGYPEEPWIWRLQRALLRSPWWRGPVMVYGDWPNQPAQVVPLFTSVLTAEQLERAQAVAGRKTPASPLTVLFVGRLSAGKNVHVLLSAVAALAREGIPLRCCVVGEGSERPALEAQVTRLDLWGWVEFAGGLPFDRVLDYYEGSDALVLASEAFEGWPKAITEAMAFGLICIGSDRGLVPAILGDGRGLVVAPGDVEALASSLRQIAISPEAFQSMRERAASWSQQYSREGLREALRELLSIHWRTSIGSFHQSVGSRRASSGV
jgi:glycosyltransferase involved in cell wall biosynthesis